MIQRYELPEAERFAKQFCTKCGSGVPYVNRDGTKLVIPAGSLTEPIEFPPEKNIFGSLGLNGMNWVWKHRSMMSID